MNILEMMNSGAGFWTDHRDMPGELQKKAKMLCWKYNQTSPEAGEERSAIWRELFGTCHAGVIAAGNPCRGLREVTQADVLEKTAVLPGKVKNNPRSVT